MQNIAQNAVQNVAKNLTQNLINSSVFKIFAKSYFCLATFFTKSIFCDFVDFGKVAKFHNFTKSKNISHTKSQSLSHQKPQNLLPTKSKNLLSPISRLKPRIFALLFFSIFAFMPSLIHAAPTTIPTVNLSLSAPDNPAQLVTSLNVVVVLTLLILAPSLILVMTSFMRLAIVFSFLRTALGTQQSPPTQILISLALVLTFFIMEPVGKEAWEKGVKPYIDEKISYDVAFERASEPFKNFMLKNTREKDLALFYRIRSLPNPKTTADVPLSIAIPAFMISELKTAFMIGFLLYLPFLVIDMVVSSILMAMGMMMVPPVMISLPFKILVFVLVDGFNLLIGSLVQGFK